MSHDQEMILFVPDIIKKLLFIYFPLVTIISVYLEDSSSVSMLEFKSKLMCDTPGSTLTHLKYI